MLKIAPHKFVDFSTRLFERQREYFDASVVHEARNQTYARLARLAAEVGVEEGAVLRLLVVSDRPGDGGGLNGGNGVTDDVKMMVKVCFLLFGVLRLGCWNG